MPRNVARVAARWLGGNVPCSTAADKLAAASRTALRAGPHQLMHAIAAAGWLWNAPLCRDDGHAVKAWQRGCELGQLVRQQAIRCQGDAGLRGPHGVPDALAEHYHVAAVRLELDRMHALGRQRRLHAGRHVQVAERVGRRLPQRSRYDVGVPRREQPPRFGAAQVRVEGVHVARAVRRVNHTCSVAMPARARPCLRTHQDRPEICLHACSSGQEARKARRSGQDVEGGGHLRRMRLHLQRGEVETVLSGAQASPLRRWHARRRRRRVAGARRVALAPQRGPGGERQLQQLPSGEVVNADGDCVAATSAQRLPGGRTVERGHRCREAHVAHVHCSGPLAARGVRRAEERGGSLDPAGALQGRAQAGHAVAAALQHTS